MTTAPATSVLRIDASMRTAGSITRDLADEIVAELEKHGPVTVTTRDLAATPIPQVDETWIGANFTPPEERTDSQKDKLALSDTLVAELQAADTLVIGLPVYNFGVPAALKAWIDMVCRARVTFRYSENGPVGLLEGKRAIIALASGGTSMDTPIDFATPYIRHVMGFIGIKDVTVVAADGLMMDEGRLGTAKASIPTVVAGMAAAAE